MEISRSLLLAFVIHKLKNSVLENFKCTLVVWKNTGTIQCFFRVIWSTGSFGGAAIPFCIKHCHSYISSLLGVHFGLLGCKQQEQSTSKEVNNFVWFPHGIWNSPQDVAPATMYCILSIQVFFLYGAKTCTFKKKKKAGNLTTLIKGKGWHTRIPPKEKKQTTHPPPKTHYNPCFD